MKHYIVHFENYWRGGTAIVLAESAEDAIEKMNKECVEKGYKSKRRFGGVGVVTGCEPFAVEDLTDETFILDDGDE